MYLKLVINFIFLIILDEQGDGDYLEHTEKNQLYLWEVLSDIKNKCRMNIDSLNNTI